MSNCHNFSPSTSPDNCHHDLLLPLPRGGRRSPCSRLFAFLYKDEFPTVGTEGYTDDSISSCDEVGAPLENVGEEQPYASLDKNSDNADKADAIIKANEENEEMLLDKAGLCDLKGEITRALDGGASRHAIDAIISDFLDQALAEEILSEAEEDDEIAVERLDEAKHTYKQLCSDAAQLCVSKQLVWGVAHVARSIVSGSHFPSNAAAVFRPRISAALLCGAARNRVLLSSGLLRTLVHRFASRSVNSHLKCKWPSRMEVKNRIALAQRACGRALVARICRAQIDHNLSRWLAFLDEGSARFAQRSYWLLRQQDNDSSDEEEGKQSAFEIENQIQAIEDLVTVRIVFCATHRLFLLECISAQHLDSLFLNGIRISSWCCRIFLMKLDTMLKMMKLDTMLKQTCAIQRLKRNHQVTMTIGNREQEKQLGFVNCALYTQTSGERKNISIAAIAAVEHF